MITTRATSAEIVVDGIAVAFVSSHSDYPGEETKFMRVFADTLTIEQMLAVVRSVTERYWSLRPLANTNLSDVA